MENITENKLNTIISAAELLTIQDSIDQINRNLPDGSLTDEQRATMKAINVNNKIFVEDVITEMTVNGEGIIPPYVSTENIQTDISFFDQLDGIESGLMMLLQRVSDLKRIAGDEAYTGALVGYRLFEGASAAGINSAKQSYEKLKDRFQNNGGNSRPAPTEI